MNSPRRLIVNADGFGFTHGINAGILESIEQGIVTSVSCNANFPAIEAISELVRRFPRISVGVHFNLQVGRPVCSPALVPSLVTPGGEFHRHDFVSRLLRGAVLRNELELELAAQAQRIINLGASITHWDGHQNKHLFPGYFSAACRVAQRLGIRRMRTHRRHLVTTAGQGTRSLGGYYVRHPKRLLTHGLARLQMRRAERWGFRMADRLITPGYLDAGVKAMRSTWVSLLDQLPAGTNEIYCHPGYPDDELRRYATYVDQRAVEIEVLTSREVRDAIGRNQVDLISFFDL